MDTYISNQLKQLMAMNDLKCVCGQNTELLTNNNLKYVFVEKHKVLLNTCG